MSVVSAPRGGPRINTAGPVATPRRRAGVCAALAAVALLAACAAERPKPLPLEPHSAALAARSAWQARVGAVTFPLAVPTAPAQRLGLFVVADSDGTVLALRAQDGVEQWRGSFGAALSAGVGSDGRFAAAVSRNNELVVVDQGRKLWQVALATAVSTPPLVAGERVFVVGVDRQVQAFDALDGRLLWRWQRAGGESLTLAQPALLAAYQDTLLAGQGAVLVGLDPTAGSTRWEVALTPPRGTNEVERLNDLVGPALRVGDAACARAFQTAVGCIDLARPMLRWSRTVGGLQAVGGDADYLFAADAADRVSAWKSGAGELAWTNERLLYRGLSAPLATPGAVVFGDSEGQLHFLSRADGKTVQRLATDGSPVVAQPVLAGATMLVVTRSGGLFAVRQD